MTNNHYLPLRLLHLQCLFNSEIFFFKVFISKTVLPCLTFANDPFTEDEPHHSVGWIHSPKMFTCYQVKEMGYQESVPSNGSSGLQQMNSNPVLNHSCSIKDAGSHMVSNREGTQLGYHTQNFKHFFKMALLCMTPYRSCNMLPNIYHRHYHAF